MAKNKIKIMQITHDLNIGGLQRVVVDIAKTLDKSRYQVSVCTLRESGPIEEELVRDGIKVLKLPPAPDGIDYLSFWKLSGILKKEKPHIIHTHNTQPLIDGGIAAMLARVPVQIHTDHGRQFPDKRRYMFAEWLLSHFVNQIVTVSENLKKNISSYEKIKSDKIKVIPNGIDGTKYTNKIDSLKKKKELGIDNKYSPILGFVGRLSPEKGLTYLIQAMDILVKDFPDIFLLIAGEGELSNELVNMTKDLNLDGNVRFLGPRSDINEIMSILDIFILPSLREGLPLVLLEAAASSLPIIATDVGGNSQAVVDGENGFLVRPEDANSLCNAIKKTAMDKSMKKKFSLNSLELFKNNFTMEKMINEYEAIYQDFLTCKGFFFEKYHA